MGRIGRWAGELLSMVEMGKNYMKIGMSVALGYNRHDA